MVADGEKQKRKKLAKVLYSSTPKNEIWTKI